MALSTAAKAPSSRERVRVFVEDPELASGLDPEALAAAEQITAPMLRVPQGGWDFKADPKRLNSHLGLLVIDGLLLREVLVGEVACAELLGHRRRDAAVDRVVRRAGLDSGRGPLGGARGRAPGRARPAVRAADRALAAGLRDDRRPCPDQGTLAVLPPRRVPRRRHREAADHPLLAPRRPLGKGDARRVCGSRCRSRTG